MAGRAKVFRGVLVFGGVAAPDMPAGQAHPQMDPPVLHLQTFLAASGARLDIADLVEMGALFLGHDSLPCSHLLEVLKHELDRYCTPADAEATQPFRGTDLFISLAETLRLALFEFVRTGYASAAPCR